MTGENTVRSYLQRSRDVLDRAAGDRDLVAAILSIADCLAAT
jgi:D-sedoheptulose 7-phosphate isomerase